MLTYNFKSSPNPASKIFVVEIIKNQFTLSGMTSKAFAEKLGLTPPRFSNLVKGQLEKFSLEMLIGVLLKLDHEVQLNVG